MVVLALNYELCCNKEIAIYLGNKTEFNFFLVGNFPYIQKNLSRDIPNLPVLLLALSLPAYAHQHRHMYIYIFLTI